MSPAAHRNQLHLASPFLPDVTVGSDAKITATFELRDSGRGYGYEWHSPGGGLLCPGEMAVMAPVRGFEEPLARIYHSVARKLTEQAVTATQHSPAQASRLIREAADLQWLALELGKPGAFKDEPVVGAQSERSES